MKKKVLIITDHLPWGHRSIARAIYGSLKEEESKNNLEVSYSEIKIKASPVTEFYNFLTTFLPQYGGLVHQLSNSKQYQDSLKKASLANLPELEKVCKKYKPDIVISAFFFHTVGLCELRKVKKMNFKVWTVVTDTWTCTATSFIKDADLHLVYDDRCAELACGKGIDRKKILRTGWWIRKEMYEPINKEEIKKSLGLNNRDPVIFFGGTSAGNSSMINILPVLMTLKKPVQVILNFGRNKMGSEFADQFIRFFNQVSKNRSCVKILNLGWIEKMNEIIGISDVVFAKGSPDILFETVAMEKPFVSIYHIHGNEDGDLDIIREKKLGWVKEKPGELKKFLIDFVNDPKKYNLKFKKYLKKEAEANKKSSSIILERIKNEKN